MMRLEKHGNRDASIVNRLLAQARAAARRRLVLTNNLTNIAASTLATGLLLAGFRPCRRDLRHDRDDCDHLSSSARSCRRPPPSTCPTAWRSGSPVRSSEPCAVSPDLSAVEWLVRVILHGIGMPVGENPIHPLAAGGAARGRDLLHRAGVVEKLDRDMMGGVLDLRELTVSDVMVHRTKIVMLNADDPPRGDR